VDEGAMSAAVRHRIDIWERPVCSIGFPRHARESNAGALEKKMTAVKSFGRAVRPAKPLPALLSLLLLSGEHQPAS
jgi:hypothetical protein